MPRPNLPQNSPALVQNWPRNTKTLTPLTLSSRSASRSWKKQMARTALAWSVPSKISPIFKRPPANPNKPKNPTRNSSPSHAPPSEPKILASPTPSTTRPTSWKKSTKQKTPSKFAPKLTRSAPRPWSAKNSLKSRLLLQPQLLQLRRNHHLAIRILILVPLVIIVVIILRHVKRRRLRNLRYDRFAEFLPRR